MNTPLRRSLQTLAVCCLAAAGVPASAAGTVQVAFIQPETFSDAGSGIERERNLDRLSAALQQLGRQHLADGESLDIQVLDVDLAGREDPFLLRGSGRDLRVLKGQADWPRIKLRYTLARPGEAARSDEVQLSDMNYLSDAAFLGTRSSEALIFEKRMLGAWFDQRFGPGQAPAR